MRKGLSTTPRIPCFHRAYIKKKFNTHGTAAKEIEFVIAANELLDGQEIIFPSSFIG